MAASRGGPSSTGGTARLLRAASRLFGLAVLVVLLGRLARWGLNLGCACPSITPGSCLRAAHAVSTPGGSRRAGGPDHDVAGQVELEETRRRLEDALDEIERLKLAASHHRDATSSCHRSWWSRGRTTSSPSSSAPSSRAGGLSRTTNTAAICTDAVVEKAAKLKIAQLRTQLGEDRGAPCAKKEIEEMDAKTARVKQILAQVTASKCGGAVLAERDFWQQRVFRLMSSAVLSEARAKLYEPSDVFGEELSEKELRELKRSVAQEESEEAASGEEGEASGSAAGEGDGEDDAAGSKKSKETDVEGAVRAFNRTLLSVADAVAEDVAPHEAARALLSVARAAYGIPIAEASNPRDLRRTVAPSGAEKKAMSAGVEKAHDAWLDAARRAGPQLLRGAETAWRIEDKIKVAGLVSRTKDAEQAIGKIYEGIKRRGEKWEDKWEARKARRLGKTMQFKSAPKAGETAFAGLADEWPAPKYESCALVGNSLRMLLDPKQGELINRHDTVMRLNNAPTLGYEKYVGNYTSHRLINNKWAAAYGSPMTARASQRLPLEWNVSVMVSRMDHGTFYSTIEQIKFKRADVNVLRITQPAIAGASAALAALRAKIEEWRGTPYAGRGSPSSGFIGLWLMLQICDSVDVYGMGLSTCAGVSDTNCIGGNAWHYWQADDFHDSREFSEVPHHSFQLEHDAIRALDAAGIITMHEPASSLTRKKADDVLADRLPEVMTGALEAQTTLKGRAEMMCARAIGVGCGCPKVCINPTDRFQLTNYRNAVKNAHRPLQMPKVAAAKPTVEDTPSYSDEDGGDKGGTGDEDAGAGRH